MNETKSLETLNALLFQYQLDSQQLYHDVARHFGLSDADFFLLYLLDDRNPRSLSRLSAMSGLAKQTIHSSLKKLQAEGAVELTERPNSRRKDYRLSAAGYQKYHPIVRQVIAAELEALACFDEAQLEAAAKFLSSYIQSLKESLQTLIQTKPANEEKEAGKPEAKGESA